MDRFHDRLSPPPTVHEDYVDMPTETDDGEISHHPVETPEREYQPPEDPHRQIDVPEAEDMAGAAIEEGRIERPVQGIGQQIVRQTDVETELEPELGQGGSEEPHEEDSVAEIDQRDKVTDTGLAPQAPGNRTIEDKQNCLSANEHPEPDSQRKQGEISRTDVDAQMANEDNPDRVESPTQAGHGGEQPPQDGPPAPPDEEDEWETLEPSVYIDAPFVADQNGQIPFGELLENIRNSGEETFVAIVETASDDRLEIEIDTVPSQVDPFPYISISVTDISDVDKGMTATAYFHDGSVFFSLYTRRGNNYSLPMPRGSAFAFTQAAIEHFNASGIDVRHADVEITEGESTLWPKFEQTLEATGSRVAAISAATSGVYERLGFTEIDPDVILEKNSISGRRTVGARFSKPSL